MLEVHLLKSKHLTTDGTGELRSVTQVYFHVAVQVVFPDEPFIADVALVFLIAQVYKHVLLQIVPYRERLGTLRARKHLCILVCMCVVTTQLL